jgi:acetylornithine/succinyldiaminopimelate/putrescine aminotransferase
MSDDLSTRECIDLMSAYGAVNFGHCNPAIARPEPSSDVVACLYPPEADMLAEWLCRTLGLPDHEVLYQVGGSFAVATAAAIAQRRRPGRMLSIRGSFHGLGIDALALTGVHREFALQRTPWSSAVSLAVDQISAEEVPSSWDGISSIIFEPVQGANGYVPLPLPWLAELSESAREHGVTVIADEIQSGYFRHGSLSVARNYGITPDILLFGKSLTNGRYPLSVVMYRSGLLPGRDDGVWLAHTFQTGAEGFRAACAVAEYIDSNPVEEYCAAVGNVLSQAASELTARGAVECFVSGPTLSFKMPGTPARQIVRACFAHGVLPFTGGASGERIRVAPPITIPIGQLEHAISVLLTVIDDPGARKDHG